MPLPAAAINKCKIQTSRKGTKTFTKISCFCFWVEYKLLGFVRSMKLNIKMTSSELLYDQTAIVTGASRGIGKAVALALGKLGAEVIVNYSTSSEKAEEVVSLIKKSGGKAYPVKANVADEDSVNQLIKTVLEKSQKINILINNAGITRDGLIMRMKTQDWQTVINLNLTGVFLCTRAVSRQMIKQRQGRIINITSVVGLMGNAGQANYASAKAGVIGLTKSTAKEFASRGITVNAVAPGFIETDMTKELNAEGVLSVIPLGRFGSPEDVAGTVEFLAASPAASYITGQTIQVDGGMVMS